MILDILKTTTDDWQYHYSFGKPIERQTSSGISTTVVALLVINYAIAQGFANGCYFEESDWQERCSDLLQEISSEKNQLITKFQTYGGAREMHLTLKV